MKSTLFILLIIPLVIAGCKDKSIQISGKLNNPERGDYLFLSEVKASEIKNVDSVKMESNGKFSFKREIEIPTFYVMKKNNQSFLMILAEPGEKISVSADFNSLNSPESVSGSPGTQKMLDYNKALKNTIEKLRGLNEVFSQNSDNPDRAKLIHTLDSTGQLYLKEINTYTKKYIDENLNSLVSLVALYQQVNPQVYVLNPLNDIAYFIKVDSNLMKRYPASDPVKSLHEQVLNLVNQVNKEKGHGAIESAGNEAPEIVLPSPSGEIIKLSSTKGKIVLLDFWASWCGPCRRENPNLVRAYNTFKNRGFQIYQVSLDKTKEDWQKGIEQDMLGQWIHVSDLKYWNSSVVPLYKIESIPFNLLLDKDGKVIASNLRGDQLINKLTEVMK